MINKKKDKQVAPIYPSFYLSSIEFIVFRQKTPSLKCESMKHQF
ncbi:hypothetical protein FORC087_103 (plasmid) [Bacillus cereus]|nr:hypothetical protein FORC087_103 [Bacillus cereus]